MSIDLKPTAGCCGAVVSGIDLSQSLSEDLIGTLRQHWVDNKVLIFPKQTLTPDQLVQFSLQFGEIGDDPFFGHIEEHEQVAAIQRRADETTPIFAEIFHTDWSFLKVPPAGTALYGITIPPHGGNTLFADQVAAYDALPESLQARIEDLIAIHSAELGYAPDGAYGENDQSSGRSMKIITSERARETC